MNDTSDYRNHFGRGSVETHPLFARKYLPENIASFVETCIFLLLYIYILLFLTDLAAMYFGLDNMITAIASDYVHPFLLFLQIPHSYFGLLATTAILVAICFLLPRYFDYVKYNLHPRDDNS